MSTNRALLDLLGRHTLVRLTREHGLAKARENDERRKALAHSYQGNIEALIIDLTRRELVDLFKNCTFEYRGVGSFVSNPGKYRHDELQAFAIRAFAGRRVRIPGDFTPVELEDDKQSSHHDSPDEDDNHDLEEHESEKDDDDDHKDEVESEARAPIADALQIDNGSWSRPRMIGRILAALGFEPVQRLSSARFRRLIALLIAGGVDACLANDPKETILTVEDESPGIDAKLRLRLSGEGARGASSDRRGPRASERNHGTSSRPFPTRYVTSRLATVSMPSFRDGRCQRSPTTCLRTA